MKKTSIGGQAVIEGVMMRGPENIAVAVRKSNGEIVLDKKKYEGISKKYKIFGWPILRGFVAFFESLIIGTRTLMFSAEQVDLEDETQTEETKSKVDEFLEKTFGDKLQDAVIWFSVILALILGVGLFILAPNWLAGFLEKRISNPIALNFVEGLVRLFIFFIYIASISKMKDIQRVFQYHGAEHKTIFCYESGKELTVENVRGFSRLHPRCGTSFLIIVMVVSFIVFSFTGWGTLAFRILTRLALLPLVAGLSYEMIKWAGRSESKIACHLSKPGMWFQLMTTKEPDDDQIEVAIAALQNVLVEDKEADLW